MAELKSPDVHEPMRKAIHQLLRCSNQRREIFPAQDDENIRFEDFPEINRSEKIPALVNETHRSHRIAPPPEPSIAICGGARARLGGSSLLSKVDPPTRGGREGSGFRAKLLFREALAGIPSTADRARRGGARRPGVFPSLDGRGDGGRLKAAGDLFGREPAPGARLQRAERQSADRHADEAEHLVAQRAKHSPDLPIFPLAQPDGERRATGARGEERCRFKTKRFAAGFHAAQGAREGLAVRDAADDDFILFARAVARVGDGVEPAAVVAEEEHPLGLDVEAARMGEGVKIGRKQIVHGAPRLGIVSRAGVSRGFVHERVTPFRVNDRASVALHAVGGGMDARRKVADDGAVERHAPFGDEAFDASTRAEPRGGEEGVDARVFSCFPGGGRGYAAAFVMLTHVVMIWFRKDVPAEAVARFRARADTELRGIPGVKHLHCGTPIPSDRPVVDKSYSVALAMAFDGRAELGAYAAHPVHQKFSEECIRPFVERLLVYDFE